MEIFSNPYFEKVTLTILAIAIKIVVDTFIKPTETIKGISKLLLTLIYYVLPLTIIVWLNIDGNIENSKFTTTIIVLNFVFLLFNYFQSKINETNKMLEQLAKTEFDKVEKVKQINAVQVEKVKSINENQKYILSELSNINDRIIEYFKDKSKK
ncbi:ERCC4-type nuclease [Psychroflexus sp. MBR-150]